MKMKILFLRSFFLVLITGLILSSCSKNDTKTDPIVGTWTTGTSTFSVMVGDKTLTQYFVDVMGLSQADAESNAALLETFMKLAFTGTITFKSNNTYTSNLGGTADSGTWSLNTDQTILTLVSSTEGPMVYTVSELTSSKLHVQVSGTTPYDLNSDGTDEILSIDVDIDLTK
jgi:hypothetical protein